MPNSLTSNSKDCVSTSVAVPSVDVEIQGPKQATVGDEVTFTVVVTNRGASPTGRLLIKDRFDAGLEHAVAQSPIERDLGDPIAPGTRGPGSGATPGVSRAAGALRRGRRRFELGRVLSLGMWMLAPQ